ncbi:MAG: triose-phosphate isomerase [Nitrospirota bacterium]
MNAKRRPILAGNWKMNMTATQARELASKLIPLVANAKDRDIVLGPPFTSIAAVADAIKGTNIGLSAQNLHWEDKGAFTGEISADMLLDSGCKYVIIGHSERRQYFGETDETVNKKVRQALKKGLLPILCVGETLAEREAGKLNEIISRQVTGGLKDVSAGDMAKIIIAYEPVWAIGTGKTATPEQANEVHALIREKVKALYSADIAECLRIQYGGSVTPENVSQLMAKPDIDGALVGGASLKPESFAALVNFK